MEWFYSSWISTAAGYAVLIAAAILLIYSVLYIIIGPKPKKAPRILTITEIQTAIRIVQDRTRNERKSRCNCGIFVACDKHSLEMDKIDEQLKKEGK